MAMSAPKIGEGRWFIEAIYRALTSSSGVKSLTMLKSFRISSGVLPLIMLATVLQPTSLSTIKAGEDE